MKPTARLAMDGEEDETTSLSTFCFFFVVLGKDPRTLNVLSKDAAPSLTLLKLTGSAERPSEALSYRGRIHLAW